jgi:glycosyltransferase involved in cell wall biosynthesis
MKSGQASPQTLQSEFASLCVLSYERPTFLSNSLDSLQERPCHPYELIIHDDGSSNQITRELLSNKSKDNATVILNPKGHNQGQGVALNRMFEMAKGDPIIKLDADLQYYHGWLSETVRLLRLHPEIGLLGLLHYYHEPVDSHKTVIDRYDEWSSHTHILGSGFAMRRSCWEELGPFEEHSSAFAEDYDMQCRVTDSNNWVCALPKESLVANLGMGIGNSVVVLDDGNGGAKVAEIHTQPFIIGADHE